MNQSRHQEKGSLPLAAVAGVAAIVLLLALASLGVARLAGAGRAAGQVVTGGGLTSPSGSDGDSSSTESGGSSSGQPGQSQGDAGSPGLPIEVAVAVEPSRLSPGQVATFTLKVRNLTREAVTADFKTSLEADFTVESGERIVWQWSRSREISLAGRQVVIGPRQTVSFKAVWEGRDDSGRDLPIGDYTVKGVFLGQLAGRALPLITKPAPVVVTP
ncbi:MAG: BsuPI-related putative proteinase inhibitor [Bacillota bacterium]